MEQLMKITVFDKIDSKKIQSLLYQMHYRWKDGTYVNYREFETIKHPFYIIIENNRITCTESYEHFFHSNEKEANIAFLEETLSIHFDSLRNMDKLVGFLDVTIEHLNQEYIRYNNLSDNCEMSKQLKSTIRSLSSLKDYATFTNEW